MRWLLATWLSLLAACQPAPSHYATPAGPPAPPRFCTRTLGVAQCFANPDSLPNHPSPLADGETALSPAQEKDRAAAARWWAF